MEIKGAEAIKDGYDSSGRPTSVASPLYPGGAVCAYGVLDSVSRAMVAGRDHVLVRRQQPAEQRSGHLISNGR